MKFILFLGLGALLTFTACTTVVPEFESDVKVETRADTILIVDQTGKAWDVTHAAKTYAMRPELFQFGLGPFAIRPIIEPQMLLPGERGYLASDRIDLVIATTIGGDSRAYRISDLNAHEVVDDVFGDVHVAVGW